MLLKFRTLRIFLLKVLEYDGEYDWYDVTLVHEDKQVQAHTVILLARRQFFKIFITELHRQCSGQSEC